MPEPIDTLTPYLAQYSLGEKIRRLRLRKNLGLVELGRHTGLSAAMLSKLENNHVVPTLQTLSRIALVFSVGLDHFLLIPAGTIQSRLLAPRNGWSLKRDLTQSKSCTSFNASTIRPQSGNRARISRSSMPMLRIALCSTRIPATSSLLC
ncbi:MAG: helix-turn-helix transcriptional regulator [bacterium]|nr:helix-turn-helix transcriptional regulator [bacterium]